jgi:hypothetical protein
MYKVGVDLSDESALEDMVRWRVSPGSNSEGCELGSARAENHGSAVLTWC